MHRSLPGIVVQALAAETVSQGAPRTLADVDSIAGADRVVGGARCADVRQRNGIAQPGARWHFHWRQFSRCRVAFAYDRGCCSTLPAPMLVVTLLFVAAIVRSLGSTDLARDCPTRSACAGATRC